MLGKALFLREVLSSYGWDKPLLHTEGALLCPSSFKTSCNPPGPAFYEAQADYVVWLYVRNWAEGLLGTMWYTLDGPGWQESALLDGGQQLSRPIALSTSSPRSSRVQSSGGLSPSWRV